VRCFALGKVARLLRKFSKNKEPLNRMQKQLLKGFYTANKYEILDIKVGDEDDMYVGDIDFTRARTVVEKYIAKAGKLNRAITIKLIDEHDVSPNQIGVVQEN
jgi:hypothetical protein